MGLSIQFRNFIITLSNFIIILSKKLKYTTVYIKNSNCANCFLCMQNAVGCLKKEHKL